MDSLLLGQSTPDMHPAHLDSPLAFLTPFTKCQLFFFFFLPITESNLIYKQNVNSFSLIISSINRLLTQHTNTYNTHLLITKPKKEVFKKWATLKDRREVQCTELPAKSRFWPSRWPRRWCRQTPPRSSICQWTRSTRPRCSNSFPLAILT